MRHLMKFVHSLGAAGMTGAVGALAVILITAPAWVGAGASAPVLAAMAQIAAWIIGPSMVLTVITGLLAMVATPPFQEAGWVWAKAATGIIILEGGLQVLGPIQEEAKRSAAALTAGADAANVADLVKAESGTLWLLLAVSVANIALGVWRPRMPKIPL